MASETVTNVDAKGRPIIEEMTERDLLVEVAYNLRAFSDALETLSRNPMLAAMVPGFKL